jgi:hypothetical protein
MAPGMREARITLNRPNVGIGHTPSGAAHCYACGALLAIRGATVRLADGLVSRPDKHPGTGLPRYGLPRRAGHGDPREVADRLANAASRDIGNPGAFYVNCLNCDRGQIVRWPSSGVRRG